MSHGIDSRVALRVLLGVPYQKLRFNSFIFSFYVFLRKGCLKTRNEN